jgi:hypothetical protein
MSPSQRKEAVVLAAGRRAAAPYGVRGSGAAAAASRTARAPATGGVLAVNEGPAGSPTRRMPWDC